MSINYRGLFQPILLFVVLFQLPIPSHAPFGVLRRGRKRFCGAKYTEPITRAIKSPDIEPTMSKRRKIFNAYKCLTRKMREELITPHEDSRIIRSITECCSEIYYKKTESKKCKKLAKRMKICLDFALALSEDLLTQGAYRSIGAQPLIGVGGLHHMGPSLFGGPHSMHGFVPPYYGHPHPFAGMPPPPYGGYPPMHPMINPGFGGHPMRNPMVHPFY